MLVLHHRVVFVGAFCVSSLEMVLCWWLAVWHEHGNAVMNGVQLGSSSNATNSEPGTLLSVTHKGSACDE